MVKSKKLVLRSEHLQILSDERLSGIAGAVATLGVCNTTTTTSAAINSNKVAANSACAGRTGAASVCQL
jgi:hypothetical protein